MEKVNQIINAAVTTQHVKPQKYNVGMVKRDFNQYVRQEYKNISGTNHTEKMQAVAKKYKS
tara:strand:- start:3644 stop:3826 length:183 start_codon:yes stop_codon:yes gene_type:complete